MNLKLMKRRFLKRPLIAVAIMLIVVTSAVFLTMRGTAQIATQTCDNELIRHYMEIIGIDGEATIGLFDNQIEVERFTYGLNSPSAIMGPALRRGDAELFPITVVKHVDKTTPKLYDKALHIEVLPFVILRSFSTCMDTKSKPVQFFQVEITNVLIASIRTYHGAHALEELILSFEVIKWTWMSEKGMVEAEYRISDE